MRHFILIVYAGVTLSAEAGRPPSALDQPMGPTVLVEDLTGRNPCLLWTALEQLARQAHVRIGFEQTLDCGPAPWRRRPFDRSLDLGGLTPRQAFDRILSQRPDYRWAEVDGVVVIRPVTAWGRGGSVLNAPVAPFAVADEHPHDALHTVFQTSQPSLFQEHTDLLLSSNGRRLEDPYATTLIDNPVPVRFAGGTVVEALNAVTRGFGGAWQAAYTRRGDDRRSLGVFLYTLDAEVGVTQLHSAAFSIAASAAAQSPSRPLDIHFTPTRQVVAEAVLDLAGTGPDDVVYDLGSGDGRLVILAAQRHGARGVGYELQSSLLALSRQSAIDAGVAERVRFVEEDLRAADLAPATVVLLYLSTSLTRELTPKLLRELRPGARIVSHQFLLADRPPDRSATVEGEHLYLWIVPPR